MKLAKHEVDHLVRDSEYIGASIVDHGTLQNLWNISNNMTHIASEIHNFPVSARDLGFLIVGEKIGSGMSRDVYEYLPNKKYVIKVENYSNQFQNVLEYEIWNNIRWLPKHVSQWFAPCGSISPNGIFLLQERTREPSKYPEKVPYFFKDLKKKNFGMIGKKFVCHDYGSFLREGHFSTQRMKKVEWYE